LRIARPVTARGYPARAGSVFRILGPPAHAGGYVFRSAAFRRRLRFFRKPTDHTEHAEGLFWAARL